MRRRATYAHHTQYSRQRDEALRVDDEHLPLQEVDARDLAVADVLRVSHVAVEVGPLHGLVEEEDVVRGGARFGVVQAEVDVGEDVALGKF